jgi:hypothetical protein
VLLNLLSTFLGPQGPVAPPTPSIPITLSGTVYVELEALGIANLQLASGGDAIVELEAEGEAKLKEAP